MFQIMEGGAFAGLGCPYDRNVVCQMLNINGTAWTWTMTGPDAGACLLIAVPGERDFIRRITYKAFPGY